MNSFRSTALKFVRRSHTKHGLNCFMIFQKRQLRVSLILEVLTQKYSIHVDSSRSITTCMHNRLGRG